MHDYIVIGLLAAVVLYCNLRIFLGPASNRLLRVLFTS